MSVDDWMAFSKRASWYEAREKANSLGIDVVWSPTSSRRQKAITRCRLVLSTPSQSLGGRAIRRSCSGWKPPQLI